MQVSRTATICGAEVHYSSYEVGIFSYIGWSTSVAPGSLIM
jgi:hypothetical protein